MDKVQNPSNSVSFKKLGYEESKMNVEVFTEEPFASTSKVTASHPRQ
jgi:hypothetical protein